MPLKIIEDLYVLLIFPNPFKRWSDESAFQPVFISQTHVVILWVNSCPVSSVMAPINVNIYIRGVLSLLQVTAVNRAFRR